LNQLGLPGQCITIEITEGLLLDATAGVQAKLLDLRDAGIQVALDDFGTGYSSLSYLKKFDIDYIKIDRSFVRNLTATSDDMALCEAIIVMAHKLGLKVIAEGIETGTQRHLLAAAGCDLRPGTTSSAPPSASAGIRSAAQVFNLILQNAYSPSRRFHLRSRLRSCRANRTRSECAA
jgi:EAL domain-containing protein (putative c-di-GMP-specific phosphodiesterase class I)